MLPNVDSVAYASKDASYYILPVLNDELKTAAQDAGWPAYIVAALSVDFDGEEIYVKYPDQYANEIDDLEYGKPYGLPNPVIRPFASRSGQVIENVLVSYTLDDLIEMEQVF